MSNKLAWLEANVAELKRAAEKLQGGAATLPGGVSAGESRLSGAVSEPVAGPPAVVAQGGAPGGAASASAPVVPANSEPPPVVRTPPAATGAAADDVPWLLYGVLAVVLLLALFLVRRRRNAAVEPFDLASEQAPAGVTDGDAPFSLAPEAAAAVRSEESPHRATTRVRAATSIPVPAAAAPAAAARRESALPAVSTPALPVDHGMGGAAPALELAEIMLSFGRVSGAARTLEEYIAALPQESARPWIRLLHLYQRNGMRQEFEALTVKLNRNFNVEILAWEEERRSGELELEPIAGIPAKAETLADIPRLRDDIVALWGKPECRDYLENLLRDNRQGKRKGFPLAIAEEILFLIDLAAAREVSR
jgi:MYXO-CTERM domain-containing protein